MNHTESHVLEGSWQNRRRNFASHPSRNSIFTPIYLCHCHTNYQKKTTQKGQQRDNKAKYKDTTTNEASNHRNTQLGSVLSAKTPWEVSELGTSPTNRTRAKVVKFIQSRWSRWPPVASPHAGAAGTFAAHRGRQRGHVNRERKVPEGSPGNQGGSSAKILLLFPPPRPVPAHSVKTPQEKWPKIGRILATAGPLRSEFWHPCTVVRPPKTSKNAFFGFHFNIIRPLDRPWASP